MIYVANYGSNTVSVINGTTNTKVHDISVGRYPSAIAAIFPTNILNRIYVANSRSNTVSVINGTTNTKERDISVGPFPSHIAYGTDMIYVANEGYLDLERGQGTVSVIDPSSDKVVAGVIFNVNPANSGQIRCNNEVYPTSTYLYMDAGTNCIAQPNKDFEFNTWVESPLTNHNSSIPLDSSGNLTVNRYGAFVNFKPLPPPIPPEYWSLIITVILTSIIGWSIPSIFGWAKARTQLKHLEECINQIGKLDKNAIEDKMKVYYVHGKISEEHRQFLKDRISEYYDSVTGPSGPSTKRDD
ncbi:MAG: YncE family protein [Candidatus Nitrosopolaris sp.]